MDPVEAVHYFESDYKRPGALTDQKGHATRTSLKRGIAVPAVEDDVIYREGHEKSREATKSEAPKKKATQNDIDQMHQQLAAGSFQHDGSNDLDRRSIAQQMAHSRAADNDDDDGSCSSDVGRAIHVLWQHQGFDFRGWQGAGQLQSASDS